MDSIEPHAWLFPLYKGVNFSLEGNGGIECFHYLSLEQRFYETIVIVALSLFEIIWTLKLINKPKNVTPYSNGAVRNDTCNSSNVNTMQHTEWPFFKNVLLTALALIFGIEVGYKLVEDSLIYLLNPCHVLTITQIFLLCANHKKNSFVTRSVFRVHLHLLSGALLAILFPVVNTRHYTFEVKSYWLHHLFIYFIPIYMIYLGGSYNPEPLSSLTWPILSIGIGFLYHFTLLEGLAMLTTVNLNNILCPAISDPFVGKNYRMWALAHQHLLNLLHGKLYFVFANVILRFPYLQFKKLLRNTSFSSYFKNIDQKNK